MPRGKPRGQAPTKGLGVIKCYQCNKPVKDHSLLEPCPELMAAIGDARMTVASPRQALYEGKKHQDREVVDE